MLKEDIVEVNGEEYRVEYYDEIKKINQKCTKCDHNLYSDYVRKIVSIYNSNTYEDIKPLSSLGKKIKVALNEILETKSFCGNCGNCEEK